MANAAEDETTLDASLYDKYNQRTHVIDGVKVLLLSDSLLQQSAATSC
jgi:hypothetical protein